MFYPCSYYVATEFRSKHFEWDEKTFAADAKVDGSGRQYYVTVTKTKKAHDSLMKDYNRKKVELDQLNSKFGELMKE